MKPSIYIDTTIPSYYVDERQQLHIHIQRTREWWDNERESYHVFTSIMTLRELEEEIFPRQKKAMKIMDNVPLLELKISA